jgi:hypothetical protein
VCFSPEADVMAGIVVSGVGVDALRHVRHRRYLPLAVIPLILGLHQVVEAFAWWGMQGRVSFQVGHMATWWRSWCFPHWFRQRCGRWRSIGGAVGSWCPS